MGWGRRKSTNPVEQAQVRETNIQRLGPSHRCPGDGPISGTTRDGVVGLDVWNAIIQQVARKMSERRSILGALDVSNRTIIGPCTTGRGGRGAPFGAGLDGVESWDKAGDPPMTVR